MRIKPLIFLLIALLLATLIPPYVHYGAAATTSSFTATVVGTSNTQAVLSYTAPTASACTVEVSENSSYAPLVHDVDPTLFSGADQDSRPEDLTAGQNRIVVIGQRLSAVARDGNVYSRALQAFTTHYYRITCDTSVATGTFTTKNIPPGMTYNDVPQVDAAHPGEWLIPTQIQDRSQTIIDPQTGALLKRVSLDTERINPAYYQGPFLAFGGFNRLCSNAPTGPAGGDKGYLCSFPDMGGGPNLLYFVIPTTGEVRFLGKVPYGTKVNGVDLSLYHDDGQGNVFQSTYIGAFASASDPALTSWLPYNSISYGTLLKQFDPSFDETLFGCSAVAPMAHGYALFQCNRGEQDSYGWLGVVYGGDGRPLDGTCDASDPNCPRVIAAMNIVSAPATRWCGSHNIQMVPGSPLVSLNFQNLRDFSGKVGTSPMATTLVNDIDGSQTSLTVAGEPQSLAMGGDPFHQDAAVGDYFNIGDENNKETVLITGISTSTDGQLTWEIQRGNNARSFSAGTTVWAACKAGFNMAYWKFLDDPHGQDTSNTSVVIDTFIGGGGHWDSGPLGRIAENGNGWEAIYGDIMTNLNKQLSVVITDSPQFAGARGLDYGATTAKHPSYQQDATQVSPDNQHWFLDMLPFDGGNLYSNNPGATLISGQLYKYIPGSALARKQLPTLAASGGKALVDISGPHSQISGGVRDSYTYCIAALAGECRTGSAVGDVYINAPDVRLLYCSGGDGPNPQNQDLCLGNAGAYVQGVDQIYLGSTDTESTNNSRVITHALAGVKDMFYYSTAKSIPDGSWALFTVGIGANNNQIINVWMAKLPPLQKQDSIDRSTFVRAPLTLTPPADRNIVSAKVYFGYGENGTPTQYYCTSRQEPCVATAGAVDDANPFSYAETDTYTPTPCATTCTVVLPVLPMHAAYYKVSYLNAAGTEVATDQGMALENNSAHLGVGALPSTPGLATSTTAITVPSSSVTSTPPIVSVPAGPSTPAPIVSVPSSNSAPSPTLAAPIVSVPAGVSNSNSASQSQSSVSLPPAAVVSTPSVSAFSAPVMPSASTQTSTSIQDLLARPRSSLSDDEIKILMSYLLSEVYTAGVARVREQAAGL